MKQKDLIIGCVSNYNYDNIRNWSKSLIQSGFDGDKFIITYNISNDTLLELQKDGFIIYESQLDTNIVIQRFVDIWRLLNNLDLTQYKWLISTDVKDVIFQSNPSIWLNKNMKDYKFVVASEFLKYCDEEWAVHNMNESYGPDIYQWISNKTIYNAGSIAGEVNFTKDLFFINYLLSLAGKSHNPDQASLNILLSTNLFQDKIKYTGDIEGWACQLGTTMDPVKIEKYKPKLLEPQPLIKNNKLINSQGEEYCLVHQYDRVPELKTIINQIYA